MAMLRVHLMQNWFGYSDSAMEEALYETTILRQFSGLHLDRIPDETTILNFRRLLVFPWQLLQRPTPRKNLAHLIAQAVDTERKGHPTHVLTAYGRAEVIKQQEQV